MIAPTTKACVPVISLRLILAFRPSATVALRATLAIVTTGLFACAFGQSGFMLDPTFSTGICRGSVSKVFSLPDGGCMAFGRMRLACDQPDSFRHAIRFDAAGGVVWSWTGDWQNEVARKASNSQGFYYAILRNQIYRFTDLGFDESFQGLVDDRVIPYDLNGVRVFPDGRILLAGNLWVEDLSMNMDTMYSLVWLNDQGLLDATRAPKTSSGLALIDWPFGGFVGHSYGLQYDGQAVPTFFFLNDNGEYQGELSLPVVAASVVFSFQPTASGHLLAAGRFVVQGEPDTTCLLRINTQGAIDPAFHRAAFRDTTSFFEWPGVASVLQLPGRGIVVPGGFDFIDGEPRTALAALDEDGLLREDFLEGISCEHVTDTLGFGGPYLRQRWIGSIVTGTEDRYFIHGQFTNFSDGWATSNEQGYLLRLVDLAANVRELNRESFSFAPNPASQSINILMEPNAARGQLVFLDMYGREVRRHDVQGQSFALSVAGLPAGVYLVEHRLVSATATMRRMVVQ